MNKEQLYNGQLLNNPLHEVHSGTSHSNQTTKTSVVHIVGLYYLYGTSCLGVYFLLDKLNIWSVLGTLVRSFSDVAGLPPLPTLPVK